MRLFIDPGHRDNLSDNGAVGFVIEADVIAKIVNALRSKIDFELVPDGKGSLAEAIKYINNNATADDYLISIHCNAGGGNGVEVWYYGGDTWSKTKGARLSQLLSECSGEPNRGVKADTDSRFGRFAIVRDTKPKAWLAECGFVDDPEMDDWKDTQIEGYAQAIAKFANEQGFLLKIPGIPVAPEPPIIPVVDPRDTRIKELETHMAKLEKEKNDFQANDLVQEATIASQKKEIDGLQIEKTDLMEKTGDRAELIMLIQEYIEVSEDQRLTLFEQITLGLVNIIKGIRQRR